MINDQMRPSEESLQKIAKATRQIKEAIDDLSPVELMSSLGPAVDIYAVYHGVSDEEVEKIWITLAVSSHEVHADGQLKVLKGLIETLKNEPIKG